MKRRGQGDAGTGKSFWVVAYIVAGVALAAVVAFAGLGMWINSFMGGEETYLIGAGMIDEALVAANAPYADDPVRVDILDTVSTVLGYCSLTPMLMDIASGRLSTDFVVDEYVYLFSDSDPVYSALGADIEPGDPCYLSGQVVESELREIRNR